MKACEEGIYQYLPHTAWDVVSTHLCVESKYHWAHTTLY